MGKSDHGCMGWGLNELYAVSSYMDRSDHACPS